MINLAFSDKYIYDLPTGHRFPIEKYELVKDQLVYEGTIDQEQLVDPGLVDEKMILEVHTSEYWNALKTLSLSPKLIRKIGLPVTELSVKRARNSVAGTVSAAQQALRLGVGLNLSGGTHHAYAGHGEGFCLLNDLAIAARYLQHSHSVSKIAIIDLDVHQGNGTAKIFENDISVFTFSIHGEGNYPIKKERSDLDISLPVGVQDQEYLENLTTGLNHIFEEVKPQVVFYQSGVDVMKNDRLGKMALSKLGVQERDKLVIQRCKTLEIPLVVTMGGGYSAKLPDLIDAHCNTFREAIKTYS